MLPINPSTSSTSSTPSTPSTPSSDAVKEKKVLKPMGSLLKLEIKQLLDGKFKCSNVSNSDEEIESLSMSVESGLKKSKYTEESVLEMISRVDKTIAIEGKKQTSEQSDLADLNKIKTELSNALDNYNSKPQSSEAALESDPGDNYSKLQFKIQGHKEKAPSSSELSEYSEVKVPLPYLKKPVSEYEDIDNIGASGSSSSQVVKGADSDEKGSVGPVGPIDPNVLYSEVNLEARRQGIRSSYKTQMDTHEEEFEKNSLEFFDFKQNIIGSDSKGSGAISKKNILHSKDHKEKASSPPSSSKLSEYSEVMSLSRQAERETQGSEESLSHGIETENIMMSRGEIKEQQKKMNKPSVAFQGEKLPEVSGGKGKVPLAPPRPRFFKASPEKEDVASSSSLNKEKKVPPTVPTKPKFNPDKTK